MWPKFCNSSISMREVILTSTFSGFDQNFFEGCVWFKFNNLGLALGMTLKFYTSLKKGFKLKVRKFSALIPTFVEVKGKDLVGGFLFPRPLPQPFLNNVKNISGQPTVAYLSTRYFAKSKLRIGIF